MVSRADDLRFRELLTERLGAEATQALLERLPAMHANEIATKYDIAELRGELLDEMGKLRGEFGVLRGEFGELRGELAAHRAETRSDFHEFRAEMADRMQAQTWAMSGLLITGIGASTALAALVA